VLIGLVGGGVNLLVRCKLKGNGVSAAQIGLLFSVASAVYTVVSAIVARLGERSATLRVGGVSALLTGTTIVLVLVSPSTVAAVAFVLLRAPPWSTMDTIIYPLAAAGAHRAALGRGSVMGLVMLGWASASTVGPILAGAIADSAGDRTAYAVMILFCALIGLWLLRTARRAEKVPVDLSRLYGAADLDALRSEYDRIASVYDSGVGDDMQYASPRAVAGVAGRLLDPDATVLDAGAGTGLLGEELVRAGFRRLDAFDMSDGMLGQAAGKGIYRDLRVGEARRAPRVRDGVVRRGGVRGRPHRRARTRGEPRRAGSRDPARRARDLHAAVRYRPPGLRRQDRRARAGEALGAGRSRRRVPGLPRGEPGVLVRVWAFRVLDPARG
jgi:hypothetical protein